MTDPPTQNTEGPQAQQAPLPNIEAAEAFHAALFGWQLQDMPMEGVSYTVIRAGDREVGGMMATPPEARDMPPFWGSY